MKTTDQVDGRNRVIWYNPMLDPYVQAMKMTADMRQAAQEGTYTFVDVEVTPNAAAAMGGPLHDPDPERPANLISSLGDDGLHYPALDIDHEIRFDSQTLRPYFVDHADPWTGGPCWHRDDNQFAFYELLRKAMAGQWRTGVAYKLVESSGRANHWHLYVPSVGYQWDDYVKLMESLVDEHVLEPSYVRHSIGRGQSLLRPPWVTKYPDQDVRDRVDSTMEA